VPHKQKEWYAVHTIIGMISEFLYLSIPKKARFSYQFLEYDNHTRNGMTSCVDGMPIVLV